MGKGGEEGGGGEGDNRLEKSSRFRQMARNLAVFFFFFFLFEFFLFVCMNNLEVECFVIKRKKY